MNLVKKYSEIIIKPLEYEIYELRKEFYTKKSFINKDNNKEYIDMMEKILFEYYKKFELFIDKQL